MKDQKKGTKGQWKRRARMQYMENKGVELKEVGEVTKARNKRESSEQEDNLDCMLARLPGKKGRVEFSTEDTHISEVEETSRQWS